MPLQAAAGLRVVDGHVAWGAAGEEEVVAAVDAQRGERRVEAARPGDLLGRGIYVYLYLSLSL